MLTRKQFESMPRCFGGDLWNDYKLAYLIFRSRQRQDVQAFSVRYQGSGLYVDVKLQLNDFRTIEATVYESGRIAEKETVR